ncbi:hypothetical protein NQ317_005961 [Molorchus minor]|uniref:Transmembrane protein n=1 Tax=Molorchus minor TaxID=1323400 RepID=A0ABQ9JM97_9CUCU|nr:hypothetical protein NQ317_005961 [Molorchus minor]
MSVQAVKHDKMIVTNRSIVRFVSLIFSFVFFYSIAVEIGGRRFVDVPSSCTEGKVLVHSGDCLEPFAIGINNKDDTVTGDEDTTDVTTVASAISTSTLSPPDHQRPPEHEEHPHHPPRHQEPPRHMPLGPPDGQVFRRGPF